MLQQACIFLYFFWHFHHSINDTRLDSLGQKTGADPFHWCQPPVSNCSQKWPPVIYGADCQRKSAFKDVISFCLDEMPKLTNLGLKLHGLPRIGTHFFTIENRNSFKDKTYHFDCKLN